jgi:hypothetical protein
MDQFTDEKIAELAIAAGMDAMEGKADDGPRMYWEGWDHQLIAFARALRPVPVPVWKRLPGPEDCDSANRCWLCGKVEGDWRLISVVNPGVPHLKYCFSHWLPHWALPVPAAGEGKVQS